MKLVVYVLILYLMYIYLIPKKHKIYGKIARNNKELNQGLMFRKKKLQTNEGMLFPMSYQKNSMWMKNTYLSLDVIFLNESMEVLGFVENTIPLSHASISIDKKSTNVLEMNAGSIKFHKIKVGDKILFVEMDIL